MNQFRSYYNLIRSKISADSVSEMGWVAAGQAANVIFSFIILKILSKLGTEHYGIYALVVSIAVFVGMIFYTPLSQGFIRFYYHYLEKKLTKTFVGMIYRILLSSIIVLLIVSVISLLTPSFIDTERPGIFFLAAGLYVIASKINEFFNSVLNLIRKRKQNSLLQGSEKAATILLLSLLLFSSSLHLTYVLFVLVIVTLSSSAAKLSIFRKSLPGDDDPEPGNEAYRKKEMTAKLLKYMTPFFIWGFSGWLQLNGEKWIINGFLSTSDVGIYAMMLGLVNGLVIVPFTVISDFWTPIIYKQYADMENRNSIRVGMQYIRINSVVIFCVALFSSFVTYFWGKELIILISSADYAVYWYLLPLLCMGTGLFYTGQALTVHGMALNVPKKYLTPKVAVGFVSVALNILMIKIFGLNGVAYTILIVGTLYLFYIALINRKLLAGALK